MCLHVQEAAKKLQYMYKIVYQSHICLITNHDYDINIGTWGTSQHTSTTINFKSRNKFGESSTRNHAIFSLITASKTIINIQILVLTIDKTIQYRFHI